MNTMPFSIIAIICFFVAGIVSYQKQQLIKSKTEKTTQVIKTLSVVELTVGIIGLAFILVVIISEQIH